MTDMFGEDQDTNEELPQSLADLVGEGKKYKDESALIKAVFEKDRFIEQLQNENKDTRQELKSRTNLEELIEKLSQPNREMPPTQRQEPTRENEPAPEVAQVNLTEEVKRLLQEEKTRETREANINETRTGLKERFGADYNQTLKSIAQDLGVSEGFLKGLAETSPSGFFKLVDSVAQPDRPIASPPRSQVNPQSFNQPSGRKNKAYYDEIRKKDVNLYFSPRVQNEMHAEAMRQGSAFFE